MCETVGEELSEEVSSAVPTGELASVRDLLRIMVKVAKAIRLYPPKNPHLVTMTEELHAKLARHLGEFGELSFELEPFAVTFRGITVYEHSDPQQSIAFRLKSDGIRTLVFSQGLELPEVVAFLAVVADEDPNRRHDDIVTRLWEIDLPHIRYLLEEDFAELAGVQETERPCQQEPISALLSAVSGCYFPPPVMLPKHLLMLTGEEAEWLRRARLAEAERDPVDDITSIVFAVLGGTEDPAIFKEFVIVAAKLAADLILMGEMRQALRLVRYLRQLSTLGTISAEQRQLLTTALGAILSERQLHSLQAAVDSEHWENLGELRDLLLALGAPSAGAICELLGRVNRRKARKIIVEVLVQLGRDDVQVFAPFLGDPRWYLVRNVVLILSLLQSPEALEMIAVLGSHSEARVRKEVLGFLERSQEPKAKSHLYRFLRDPVASLRIRALQALLRERSPLALKAALAMAAAETFKDRTFAERKAVCEVIGELGSDGDIAVFRSMLPKRRWLQKTVDRETVLCAVAGLSRMRSRAAIELLGEMKKRSAGMEGVIDEAIAAMSAGGAAVSQRGLRWRCS